MPEKPYRVYLEGKPSKIHFAIGVQSFELSYDPEDEDDFSRDQALAWMTIMLEDALNKLVQAWPDE